MSHDSQQPSFSHLDEHAQPRMVNVGDKPVTARRAVARGSLQLPRGLKWDAAGREILTAKGAVMQTAIVAGTQAVKKTQEMIPFCHALPLETVTFDYTISPEGMLQMTCEVGTHAKTGVEMEALTGVSVALLTVYDMCKSVGQDMCLREIEVIQKSGGKNDFSKSAD